MKKIISVLSMALLVVLLALTLTGCDKSGSIKRAFESNGYTVTEVSADESDLLKELLNEEQQKEIEKYGIMVCTKGLQSATIVIFPSADTIKDVLGETAYDKAVESGIINGNCYLALPLGLDVVDIFKNA